MHALYMYPILDSNGASNNATFWSEARMGQR